ncbi:MAG: hypothetical protein FJW38_31685 [Acidobacteria bacterium]|nr:hypothetical protein [Acidobacteriota bacterium]
MQSVNIFKSLTRRPLSEYDRLWTFLSMRARDEILKRIEKKRQEIRDLEVQLASANAYHDALQEALRLLPKDASVAKPETLRPGSAVAKAREAILKANRPLHVTDILTAIGRPVDKGNRVSLGGSLSGYVKRGEIFTRPAPNTFGLIELNHTEMPSDSVDEDAVGQAAELPVEEQPQDDDSHFDEAPVEGGDFQGISDDDVPF